MEAMGGLDWYQRASQLGQSKARGGDSSKWLIQALKASCRAELDAAVKPLRVLDVGAVAPDNYAPHASWIHAKPIDLNPQHPDIEKQDFLCMDPPPSMAMFDIVCLSLVVNFVGDPKDRGKSGPIQNVIVFLILLFCSRTHADPYPQFFLPTPTKEPLAFPLSRAASSLYQQLEIHVAYSFPCHDGFHWLLTLRLPPFLKQARLLPL